MKNMDERSDLRFDFASITFVNFHMFCLIELNIIVRYTNNFLSIITNSFLGIESIEAMLKASNPKVWPHIVKKEIGVTSHILKTCVGPVTRFFILFRTSIFSVRHLCHFSIVLIFL